MLQAPFFLFLFLWQLDHESERSIVMGLVAITDSKNMELQIIDNDNISYENTSLIPEGKFNSVGCINNGRESEHRSIELEQG